MGTPVPVRTLKWETVSTWMGDHSRFESGCCIATNTVKSQKRRNGVSIILYASGAKKRKIVFKNIIAQKKERKKSGDMTEE